MTKTEYQNRINELLALIAEDHMTFDELDTLLQEYNNVLLKYRMLYETPQEHSYRVDMFNRMLDECVKNNLPQAA